MLEEGISPIPVIGVTSTSFVGKQYSVIRNKRDVCNTNLKPKVFECSLIFQRDNTTN